MKFYFAPMEGLTGYIYRNAHHALFDRIDKYFSPFISANQTDRFKTREMNDVLPENNPGIILIPQLMTNNADDFISASKKLLQMGYDEINLNLGCPSGTVVSKHRGSGFLAKREALDAFLEQIYAQAVTKISIKTRIGKDHPDEFYALIEIYNKYPLEELIIHPRIQKDFYKNRPNLQVFRDAVHLSKNPVCYNGDIHSPEEYHNFITEFPEVGTIMLGRGLLMNPGLVNEIVSGEKINIKQLKAFHDQIHDGYKQILSGDVNVLHKMKELWCYLIESFPDYAWYGKKIKRSERLSDYNEIVASLFRDAGL